MGAEAGGSKHFFCFKVFIVFFNSISCLCLLMVVLRFFFNNIGSICVFCFNGFKSDQTVTLKA